MLAATLLPGATAALMIATAPAGTAAAFWPKLAARAQRGHCPEAAFWHPDVKSVAHAHGRWLTVRLGYAWAQSASKHCTAPDSDGWPCCAHATVIEPAAKVGAAPDAAAPAD